MGPTEDEIEFEQLLRGVRSQRVSAEQANARLAVAEREAQEANHELQRWKTELDRHVHKMSGGLL